MNFPKRIGQSNRPFRRVFNYTSATKLMRYEKLSEQ